jgi:hypothetical protein
LREGDQFTVEHDPVGQTVILKKVKAAENWFAAYMECPASIETAVRRKQFYRRLH